MKFRYKNIISYIWTADIDKALRFYGDVLGFNKSFSSQDWIEMAVPGLKTGYVAINRWAERAPLPRNDFITLGVENLEQFRDHLLENNVTLKGGITEFYEEGIKMLKFYDPDGNILTAAEVEAL